jgi:hypothetical protein
MLLTEKHNVNNISLPDIEAMLYFPLGEEEEWRVEMIRLLLEHKEHSHLDEEEEELLVLLCTE